ncbi:hypothetical protein KDA_59300 [Dictyobacter alpinus]|uniref:Zinc finger Ogr/Delta-type domain-containing protein n=1 Tax=Dictyobacter alpinus TaxID=2014873 RepID=A0A402BGI3_9CHLR|nr:hypothetical protein [Dictyobacter alpinus]GCE30446.1 hypothetical protein KDA_59300 [Dictyobacter alpinus]
MNCPICNDIMKIVRKDASYNRSKPATYDRTLFRCIDCDTWIKIEVPMKQIQTAKIVQPAS